MSTCKVLISREQLENLQHYMFVLLEFVGTSEFICNLKSNKQAAIHQEIAYIDMSISILQNIFIKLDTDIPIVGWNIHKKILSEQKYITVYYFTSAKLAARCLGLNESHIIAVCKKEKEHNNGWKFQYESEYEETTSISYELKKPKFDIIKIEYDEENSKIIKTIRDV